MSENWRRENGGTPGEGEVVKLLTEVDYHPARLGLSFIPGALRDYADSSPLLDVVRASRSAIRHMPDLVAGNTRTGPVFVEVITCHGPNHAMAQSKLEALGLYAAIAPVVVVDAPSLTAWVYRSDWQQRALGPPRTDGNGSGTPYLLFPPAMFRDARELFEGAAS